MLPQDKVDKDSFSVPRNQDSAPEEEDAEEQEPEVNDDQEEGSEYYLYHVDRLLHLDETDKLPRLNPPSVFHKAAFDEPALSRDRGGFESRLNQVLKSVKPNMPELGPELVEFLFKRAVDAHRHIRAWYIIVTKDPELAKARAYLQQELNRYVKVRSLLTEKKQRTPSWMSEWSQCWVGAFKEIQEEIESELRGAIKTVDEVRNMRSSARLEVESYILWLEKEKIREQPAAARNVEVLLAAFAYAAKLVANPGSGFHGYVDSIKQRVSRVARSRRKQAEAFSFLLRGMLALEYGKSEPEASS